MDLDPQIFFSNVTKSLQDPENGPSESLRLLDSFNRNLIEEQIDAELLGYLFSLLNYLILANRRFLFRSVYSLFLPHIKFFIKLCR